MIRSVFERSRRLKCVCVSLTCNAYVLYVPAPLPSVFPSSFLRIDPNPPFREVQEYEILALGCGTRRLGGSPFACPRGRPVQLGELPDLQRIKCIRLRPRIL